jgi:hypothetical protein
MATTCSSYMTVAEARQAVDDLLAGGVPGEDIRLLASRAAHDARHAESGSFAPTAADDGRVRDFAGGEHAAGAPMGGFAGGGAGRGGAFSDTDRDSVATFPAGVAQMRFASHRDLERVLREAGLDRETVARDLDRLHEGRVVVLVVTEAVGMEELDELLPATA